MCFDYSFAWRIFCGEGNYRSGLGGPILLERGGIAAAEGQAVENVRRAGLRFWRARVPCGWVGQKQRWEPE